MNRADRRRREKDDQQAVARGMDIEARRADQACSLMRLLYGRVRDGQRLGSLKPIFSFFYDNLTQTNRQAPIDLIACKKGCSYCCQMWVSATAPEILFIASALRRDRRDLAPIFEAIERTAGMDFDARGAFISPCPLLTSDGVCSIYQDRPLACRTATSNDAEVCRRGYIELSGEDIPQPMFYLLQRAGYAVAMRGAFRRAGLPLISYELNEGLRVALTIPDAEARWLSGEDIFAAVQQDPNGDPMDRPDNRQLYDFAFAE